MKIENSGVNVTPKPLADVSTSKRPDAIVKEVVKEAVKDGVTEVRASEQSRIAPDSVVISKGSADKAVTSGDYRARVLAPRTQSKLQPMTNLKKTADERLKQFGSNSDTVESVSELNLDDDRKDMVEIAKLRVKSGFYDRPDVVDEIARRIIEGV